jgi:hypothetical protein
MKPKLIGALWLALALWLVLVLLGQPDAEHVGTKVFSWLFLFLFLRLAWLLLLRLYKSIRNAIRN